MPHPLNRTTMWGCNSIAAFYPPSVLWKYIRHVKATLHPESKSEFGNICVSASGRRMQFFDGTLQQLRYP